MSLSDKGNAIEGYTQEDVKGAVREFLIRIRNKEPQEFNGLPLHAFTYWDVEKLIREIFGEYLI